MFFLLHKFVLTIKMFAVCRKKKSIEVMIQVLCRTINSLVLVEVCAKGTIMIGTVGSIGYGVGRIMMKV